MMNRMLGKNDFISQEPSSISYLDNVLRPLGRIEKHWDSFKGQVKHLFR